MTSSCNQRKQENSQSWRKKKLTLLPQEHQEEISSYTLFQSNIFLNITFIIFTLDSEHRTRCLICRGRIRAFGCFEEQGLPSDGTLIVLQWIGRHRQLMAMKCVNLVFDIRLVNEISQLVFFQHLIAFKWSSAGAIVERSAARGETRVHIKTGEDIIRSNKLESFSYIL